MVGGIFEVRCIGLFECVSKVFEGLQIVYVHHVLLDIDSMALELGYLSGK